MGAWRVSNERQAADRQLESPFALGLIMLRSIALDPQN